MKTTLFALAHGRSGDKGDTVNVGVIARHPEFYEFLRDTLTVERVRQHFGELVKGDVERFELPNLHALNFLLHESLGGGGTVSLMTDAQGKTFSTAMLRMPVDVPDALASLIEEENRTTSPQASSTGAKHRGLSEPGVKSSGSRPQPSRPSKPGTSK